MKTKEELNELKKEAEKGKVRELSEDELDGVTGGTQNMWKKVFDDGKGNIIWQLNEGEYIEPGDNLEDSMKF